MTSGNSDEAWPMYYVWPIAERLRTWVVRWHGVGMWSLAEHWQRWQVLSNHVRCLLSHICDTCMSAVPCKSSQWVICSAYRSRDQDATMLVGIDVLWPTKSTNINTTENVWSILLRHINGMNPLLKNAAEIRATCRIAEHRKRVHTTISGQRSTPTLHSRRTSSWTCWLLLNNWIDF